MLHLCPKCKTATLEEVATAQPAKLSESSAVPPSRCLNCHGVWMPHGALALEPDLPKDAAKPASPTGASDNNDSRVGFCPAGHGLLIRARVEADEQFFLDRCGTCAGIWFDAGEWALLSGTDVMQQLDRLWDPLYRKKLREERARKMHLEALGQTLGAETAKMVVELAAALKGNPRRSIAMAYLIDEMKEGELG